MCYESNYMASDSWGQRFKQGGQTRDVGADYQS